MLTHQAGNALGSTSSRFYLRQAAVLKISNIQTEVQLKEVLEGFSQNLKFDFFLYAGYFSVDQRDSIVRIISSYPDDWLKKYRSSNFELIDPAIHHAYSRLTPIVWSQLIYLSAEQHQFMGQGRLHGIGDGVSFPVHARNGDIGVLSFANKPERDDTDALIDESLAQGALVASYVHETMRRIVDKVHSVLRTPLTKRELECLRWVASGKSSWEISVILGISEHGVVHHMRNCMSKFGVHSRHLAVARATACGLL